MRDVLFYGVPAGLIIGIAFCAVAVDARGRLRLPARAAVAPAAVPAPVASRQPVAALPAASEWTLDDIDDLITRLVADLPEDAPAPPVSPELPAIEADDAEVIHEETRPRLGPPAPLTVAEVQLVAAMPRPEPRPAGVLERAWIAGSFGYDPTLDPTTAIRPVRDDIPASAS